MSDPSARTRFLLARHTAAITQIRRLAKHKAIPEWVSRSIIETADIAEQTIETLRDKLPDSRASLPNE